MKIDYYPYLVGKYDALRASFDAKNWSDHDTALTYCTWHHPMGTLKRTVDKIIPARQSVLCYSEDLIRDLCTRANRLSLTVVHAADTLLTVYQNNQVQPPVQVAKLGDYLGPETGGTYAIPNISPYHAYVGQEPCRYMLRDHWRAFQLICMATYHQHGEITHIEDCSPLSGQCKNHPVGHSGGRYADVLYHENPWAVYDFTWMIQQAFPDAKIDMHSSRRKEVYDVVGDQDWFGWVNASDKSQYQHHLHMHISMGNTIARKCEIRDW